MAFTTQIVDAAGAPLDVFNIDFGVGPGAQGGNHPTDIMLVQALFRIIHFEVDPVFNMPPPGRTSINVNGVLDSSTAAFIRNWQDIVTRMGKFKVLRDGILDPFRSKGEKSKIAKVNYTLEVLNSECFRECRRSELPNFIDLPRRADIPSPLRAALTDRRTVALKYQSR